MTKRDRHHLDLRAADPKPSFLVPAAAAMMAAAVLASTSQSPDDMHNFESLPDGERQRFVGKTDTSLT